jgi:hypothetical protein
MLPLALIVAGMAPASACADLLTNPLLEPGAVPLTATPVPLSTLDRDRNAVGELSWLGGLELTGRGAGFGGLSGLEIGPDGTRFLAISDIGFWVTGRLTFDTGGRLAGVDDVEAGRLHDEAGAPVGRTYRDAEGLALAPDGTAVVAFEREHRLWRYRLDAGGGLTGLPAPLTTPPGLEAAPRNLGVEAVALLADGRLVALAEGLADDRGTWAWIGSGPDDAIVWQSLRYVPAPGHAVSDAAGLPGGGLLVLERAFGLLGGRARLVHVPAHAMEPGAVVEGVEIARLAPPLTVDNFEALAVVPEDDGAVKLLIASDDNFRPFQRTLLLAFRWRPD